MKASELKPGQFFEFPNPRNLPALRGRKMLIGSTSVCNHRTLAYIDRNHDQGYGYRFSACASDVEVTPLAVTGWDDEPQPTVEPANEYRCFHCGEVFGAESAAEHFGTQMITFPACTIDVAAYRKLEEEARSYREEDTELHKQIHALNAEMYEKARRAEEAGYARGLRDAKLHPEELGLQLIAEVPPPTPEPEQFKAGDLVVCVDAKTRQAECNLVAGAVYEVRQVTHLRLALVGGCCWDKERFRRATAAEIAAYKAEHSSKVANAIVSSLDELTEKLRAQPDADGWIEHDGKGCPVDDGTLVEVRLWDGATGGPIEAKHYWWSLKPSGSHPSCITHYRLVPSPPKEPPQPITDWVSAINKFSWYVDTWLSQPTSEANDE